MKPISQMHLVVRMRFRGVASPLNQMLANVEKRTTYRYHWSFMAWGLDTGSAFAVTNSNTLFSSENLPDLVMN